MKKRPPEQSEVDEALDGFVARYANHGYKTAAVTVAAMTYRWCSRVLDDATDRTTYASLAKKHASRGKK